MPIATNGAVRLHYDTAGTGPTVAFVNDVGFGAWQWGFQHPRTTTTYEALVWDLRGTGDSDAPSGPYALSTLVGDLEAVLADHGVASVHLVGSGLGGMIALEYARRYGRAESLALFGTAASGTAIDQELLKSLRAPRDDPQALRESLRNAFAASIDDHPEVVDQIVDWRATDDADLAGWDAQAAALREATLTDLYEITTPALVCRGEADRIVSPEATSDLADALPRGDLRTFEGGHLFFIEQSRAVTDELLAFLDDQTG